MSLSAHRARLAALTKDLNLQWEQTKEGWHDSRSLEFEHRYMEELKSSVERAIVVVEQLDKLVSKVRSDCE